MSGLLLLVTALLWPRAHIIGPELPVAVGIYQSTVVLADLLTAILLLIQVWQLRTADLLVLACGYLATALFAGIQLLSFPNVAAAGGIVGGDAQTPPWLWNFWHLAFPLAVIGFATLRRPLRGDVTRTAAAALLLTVFIVVAAFVIATRLTAYLPALIDGLSFTPAFIYVNYPVMTALCVAALVMLLRRRPSVVSLWLAVSVLAFMLDIVNNWHSGARYAVGWYVGRGSGLVSSLLLLVVFVAETALLLRFVGTAAQRLDVLNTELKAALARAEAAGVAKVRFFAAASHDLRQPFQAIRLFHQVLEDGAENPQQRRVLGRLGEALAAAEGLLSAFLDVARLDGGAVEVKPQAVAVRDLLRDVAASFDALAADKGLTLRVWACPAIIETDPLLMRRVLSNLVGNAVRYTERGGILLAARRRGDGIVFEVWDTGIGIAPQAQRNVFEEFYQADNAARDRSQGIGLGLSIVQRLCAILGYEVTLASRLGRGSVFRVIGPRIRPSMAGTESAPGERRVLDQATTHKSA